MGRPQGVKNQMSLPESKTYKNLRIDHVGSLVRPAGLREAFAKCDTGLAPEAELLDAQNEAIRRVVAEQERHGLLVVNDGEFRRRNFQESFSASVSGFDEPKD